MTADRLSRHLPTLLVVVLGLACGACTGRPLQGVLVPAAQSATGVSRVPILVATTRKRSTADPGDMFSADPAQDLSYASITVSIPPDAARKIGQIQWPTTLPGNPTRDFVTAAAEYLDRQSFNKALSAAAKSTGRNKVLVFVHGFNNRFDEAVYRLAQIVQDSKAPVILIQIMVFPAWSIGAKVSSRQQTRADQKRPACRARCRRRCLSHRRPRNDQT